MDNRISGPVLLGFSDMFADGDSYGESVGAVLRRAVAAPAKPGAKPAPGGRGVKPTGKKGPIAKRAGNKGSKGKASPHKAAMANAATAGHRALNAAKGGFGKATIYKKNVKAGKHAPVVKLAAIGFTDDARVLIGAASPAVRRILTPKQKSAITRHANAAAKLSAAKKAVAAAAKVATTKGNATLAFVQKTVPIVKAALIIKPFTAGRTSVGHVAALIEEAGGVENLSDEEVLGLAEVLADTGLRNDYMTPFEAIMLEPAHMGNVEIGVDINGLSPGQPGYDPTTDIDALAASGGGIDPMTGLPTAGGDIDPMTGLPYPTGGGTPGLASVDSGTGAVLGPNGEVLYDPTTDPAVVPMPVRGQALTPDELQTPWDTLPPDAIVYGASEGGKQYPQNSVGSANTFISAEKNAHGWGPGYIFGGTDWMYPNPDDRNEFLHGSFGSTAEIENYSLDHGWGPLVGDPKGPLANLQYARTDKKWFWQGKNCPLSYSAPADSTIAQANQAIIAANRAAAVVQAKQMQADQFAAAEAQSKQDAQIALQEQAASSQANIADVQQQTQYGQLDVDTQKQGLVEQQMDAQYAQQQGQFEIAQGGIQTQAQQAMIQQASDQAKIQAAAQQQLLDQSAVWNTWAAAHPDEAVAQMNAEAAAEPQYAPQAAGPADESDDGGSPMPDDSALYDQGGLDDSMEDDLEDGTGDDFSDFPE